MSCPEVSFICYLRHSSHKLPLPVTKKEYNLLSGNSVGADSVLCVFKKVTLKQEQSSLQAPNKIPPKQGSPLGDLSLLKISTNVSPVIP